MLSGSVSFELMHGQVGLMTVFFPLGTLVIIFVIIIIVLVIITL